MKRFASFVVCVILIVLTLCIPVGAISSTPTNVNPYDWDITFVNSENVIVSEEEFHSMLSCIPGISGTGWANHFHIQNGYVTMTPQDLLTMFCYTEDEEKANQLRAEYEHQMLSIDYDDGVITVTEFPKSISVCGGEGTSFESLIQDRFSPTTRIGLRVTCTVEIKQTWAGGGTVYYKVKNVSFSSEASHTPIANAQDTIIDTKVKKTTGSSEHAHVDASVKTRSGLFSFYEYPAQFSFDWKDGYYDGGSTNKPRPEN